MAVIRGKSSQHDQQDAHREPVFTWLAVGYHDIDSD
jgi:hypothetical protein